MRTFRAACTAGPTHQTLTSLWAHSVTRDYPLVRITFAPMEQTRSSRHVFSTRPPMDWGPIRVNFLRWQIGNSALPVTTRTTRNTACPG